MHMLTRRTAPHNLATDTLPVRRSCPRQTPVFDFFLAALLLITAPAVLGASALPDPEASSAPATSSR